MGAGKFNYWGKGENNKNKFIGLSNKKKKCAGITTFFLVRSGLSFFKSIQFPETNTLHSVAQNTIPPSPHPISDPVRPLVFPKGAVGNRNCF